MKRKRILITGVCGFTGRHLVARLRRGEPTTIVGLDTPREPTVPVHSYLCCDLTDHEAVGEAIGRAQPDVVFHLAGLFGSAPVEEIRRVNVEGFVCLCNSLRRYRGHSTLPTRVVTIGSAAEIGSTAASILPVTEDVACSPDSAYGQSKLEVTRLALAERLDSSLEIVVARPFNLIGPGLSPQLSLGSFAQQAVSVLRGEAVAVRCGSLDARRDFVDIRDAVQAYVALAERGRARQVYNVCAGRSYRIGDLLERLIGLTGAPLRVVIDPARCRPGELPDIYGDHSKITREVGWRPRIPINRSLAELLAAAAVESIKRDPRAGTNRQLSKAG